MTVFGTLSGADSAESALLNTLWLWMPTYLREVERQNNLTEESLPSIRSFAIVSDYDRWPQEQLPAVQVASAGLVNGSIEKDGEGNHTARYAVEVTVTVGGPKAVETRVASQRYAQAIRAVLLQKRNETDGVEVVRWVDESFAGEGDDRMTRVTTAQSFEVQVRDLVTTLGGPTEPDEAPDDWPTVATYDIDIEKEDLDG